MAYVSPTIPLPSTSLTPRITLRSASPVVSDKPAELVSLSEKNFETNSYQSIISNASLERELLNKEYKPISKVVVDDKGEKHVRFIKALNKLGQVVFILVDVSGYTSTKPTDLTLTESSSPDAISYSLKNGAYNCAGTEVCGIAFESGSNSVSVLVRDVDELTPKESNFVFVTKSDTTNNSNVITYPIVRLSEIKVNPNLVLQNSDIVTRRLRDSAYAISLQELSQTQESIVKLGKEFARFSAVNEKVAKQLNQTLKQLEEWNYDYIKVPPTTDVGKEKLKILQYNLSLRNENIATLLKCMKKIADLKLKIDNTTKDISDIIEFADKEFVNIDKAVTD